ncbi:MAG: hypothetical protein C0434_12850 [Xanthomonadaceae bacterium]|nr:hypothetical protein [Xanthomonadaceae bacterium]
MSTYVVKSGDTLARIAAQYRTTVAALAAANGISNPNMIRVGQPLAIPGAAMTPGPVAVSVSPMTPGPFVAPTATGTSWIDSILTQGPQAYASILQTRDAAKVARINVERAQTGQAPIAPAGAVAPTLPEDDSAWPLRNWLLLAAGAGGLLLFLNSTPPKP